MNITQAKEQDIKQIVELVNSAYRGEASRAGWTTEADLIEGNKRTDETALASEMKRHGAVILKYATASGEISGCVFLEKKGESLYLGMLSVSPRLQARGIGKRLLEEASVYGKVNGCTRIYMTVISKRLELVAWYERHGYKKNGNTKPFPNDNKFGKPVQPLEFIELEKAI